MVQTTAKTDRTMGIPKTFLPATTQPMAHVLGDAEPHPSVEATRARRAREMDVGFKGAEEPTEPVPTSAQRGA